MTTQDTFSMRTIIYSKTIYDNAAKILLQYFNYKEVSCLKIETQNYSNMTKLHFHDWLLQNNKL